MEHTTGPGLRAALYCRYSSDLQSERSIEDQVRVCRARADREGWSVAEVYADYAISGATARRPQFQQLIEDACAGRFEVVVAEALDRISRDQEHIAGFFKQMNFLGLRIVTIAEGDISELHIGLGGTMSALFLKSLGQKTHRGLEGRVRAGKNGGGVSYGYAVARGLRADGTPVTGDLQLVPYQAEIVRRVFADYAAGRSPRSIAKTLNAEGVAGPRNGRWTASLLLGNASRENGMLRNRLYVGERVWNRQRFIKDPHTGKRVSRPNPHKQWVINMVPDLAIVDRALWDHVQARLEGSRRSVLGLGAPDQAAHSESLGARLAAARRPKWPLAGLVRCGLCNGPMSVAGAGGRLACANHVERGTCDNRRTVLRDTILSRVLLGLKERLLAPEMVKEFVRTYVAEVNAANRDRSTRQAGHQTQLGRLDRQIRNFLELMKDGHGSPAMVAELREIEQKREAMRLQIAATSVPEPIPTLHPNLPDLYRRRVSVLEEALQDEATALAAAEALRCLVDAVLVYPGQKRGEVSIELRGDLAAFMHLADAQMGLDGKVAVQTGGYGEVLGTLVAGTGFEPVTFRL